MRVLCEDNSQVSSHASKGHLVEGDLKNVAQPQPMVLQRKQQYPALNPSRWYVDMGKEQNPCNSPTLLLERISHHSKRTKPAVVPKREDVEKFLSHNRWMSEKDYDDDDDDTIDLDSSSDPRCQHDKQIWLLRTKNPEKQERKEDPQLLVVFHHQHPIVSREHSDHHTERPSHDDIPTPPRRKKSNTSLHVKSSTLCRLNLE
ncbi:hypothetical protein IV203_014136 [Nitzschia inconspicua]|uniref:Uncharacterized protein n=1 Tax=Nitzschia inconspicua TaxID=303405 RepID=A0A9K3Q8L2_9STRA|nr:hypothetical protein IV203_014136 [Nitzschia inconspicua]